MFPPRFMRVLHNQRKFMSEKQQEFDSNFEQIDLVAELIKLKRESKNIEERIGALETLVFSNPSLKQDDRIKVVAGRKTITLTDQCYESLKVAGVETEVVETRKKKLDEFDIEVQNAILKNKENYVEKITKESIRIK